MARKNIQPIEGQGSLLEPFEMVSANQTTSYPVTYGPDKSYVDVGERAHLLHDSLVNLGKSNQRKGFDVASHTKPMSSPIWGRYEDMTPVVIDGAQRNIETFIDKAKKDFWAATGFSALRGSGLIRESEIDPRGRKMWRDFTHRYGDPKTRSQRDSYKRQLRKAIKNSEKAAA